MGVVYSLYDALVSINVPNDKAKAVIDAMEREMMDKLATKADVAHVKELLAKDIQSQTNTMTVRLLLTAAGLVPAIIAAQRLF
jgi:hypothetical protein